MSDTSSDKYKWTPESTALLVSVWSDRQVQKQLEYAPRPQVIWEGVSRYMRKKGYNVNARQCRSRMKYVLVCHKEAKQAGTRSSLEQYYETIDQVLKDKRSEQFNINGVDTVDATANMKSPPKDVKTNKNLQMRLKVQEPVQSLYRTDALSPTWTAGRETEYPDSPESNETIVPKPYRVFSPTRDVAINTGDHFIQVGSRAVQTNPVMAEEPVREDYRPNLMIHYPYGEIPYQNAVQNVQNQIIQENMQQYQYNDWNQLPRQNEYIGLQQNMLSHSSNQRLPANVARQMVVQNPHAENVLRQQNQLQRSATHMDNRAMPQEPRKIRFGQNLQADRMYSRQYRDVVPGLSYVTDVNNKNAESLSPDYSPDVSQNLNDAFCQSKSDEKTHNLNETYNQPGHLVNDPIIAETDVTVVTNNATYNDDNLLLEYLLNSPISSDSAGKAKDNAVNTTDNVQPNAPFRKKKAQKLEQLMINAINSQNEVVNKILAAQNDMVARFLDVDRDRQNRLENRLDHLLNVVHSTVLNKNAETERESSSSSEPVITSLDPPPKPGMVPPKLDLVPPKPCRVPCTSSNVELINQNPVLTRPGIVSPITSPGRKVGTIWSKLGPVSQSPFMKAQQRLGFHTITTNKEARTQSSAERRIAQELDKPILSVRSLIYETVKLLEMERQMEEKIENARREMNMGQTLTARKKLFTQREPTPIMILTAAFLDGESRIYNVDLPYHGTWNSRKQKLNYARGPEKLLAGQGEGYERMHQLNIARNDLLGCEPCDSSTPAKFLSQNLNNNADGDIATAGIPSKPNIQQLRQLLMNSTRWRGNAQSAQPHNPIRSTESVKQQPPEMEVEYNVTFTAPKANAPPPLSVPEEQSEFRKSHGAAQPRSGNQNEAPTNSKSSDNDPRGQTKFPMGFTTAMQVANEQKDMIIAQPGNETRPKSLGFINPNNPLVDRKNNVPSLDEALAELQRMYIKRQAAVDNADEILSFDAMMRNSNGALSAQYRNMIAQYVGDLAMLKKPTRDTDSDNDEEFLDTTATVHPTCVVPRRSSLTSNGTASTHSSKTKINRCRIS